MPPGVAGEGGETELSERPGRADALLSMNAPKEIMVRRKSCCALLGRLAVVASSTLAARSGGTDALPSTLIVVPKPWILRLLRVTESEGVS